MLLAVVSFTVFSLMYVEGSQLEVPTKKQPGFSSGFGYNPKFIITQTVRNVTKLSKTEKITAQIVKKKGGK